MTHLKKTAAFLTAFLAGPSMIYGDDSGNNSAPSELKVDVYEGPTQCEEADRVSPGNYISIHYTGKIDESSETGDKEYAIFDTSRDDNNGEGGTPMDFEIGKGSVIKGWDEGLIGLCKGSKASLVIPPDMGYGEDGFPPIIPGGATLHFDVEIVGISDKAPPEPNIFSMIDTDNNGELSKEEVEAYFKESGMEVPERIWGEEDINGDSIISWEEFTGPKQDSPIVDEL